MSTIKNPKYLEHYNFLYVALILFIAVVAIRACRSTTIQNTSIKNTSELKSDSIQDLKKDARKAEQKTKQAERISTTVAMRNQSLRDSINSIIKLPEQKPEPPQVDEEKERLKSENTMLLQQRDSLLTEVRICTYRLGISKMLTVKEVDTVTKKEKEPPYFNPYIIGGGLNQYNELPKVTLSFRGTGNYSITRKAFSLGFGVQGTYKNTSANAVMYYDWAAHQFRQVVSVNQDFFRLITFKKRK